jgi:hypothetical protein
MTRQDPSSKTKMRSRRLLSSKLLFWHYIQHLGCQAWLVCIRTESRAVIGEYTLQNAPSPPAMCTLCSCCEPTDKILVMLSSCRTLGLCSIVREAFQIRRVDRPLRSVSLAQSNEKVPRRLTIHGHLIDLGRVIHWQVSARNEILNDA